MVTGSGSFRGRGAGARSARWCTMRPQEQETRTTLTPSAAPTVPAVVIEIVGEDASRIVDRRVQMAGARAHGVLYVHSAPRALCPHIEWAAGGVLGVRLTMDWIPQPAAPGMFRAELSWQAEQGTGARLTSALRGWAHLRYEVTEEPSGGVDGARWSHTP